MKLYEKMPLFDETAHWIQKNEETIEKKVTIVHFFALSCAICEKVVPAFMQLCNKYGKDVQILSIHSPREERDYNHQSLNEYINKYEMKQSVCCDDKLEIKNMFNNKCVPTYYLFDENNELRFYQAGGSNFKMLESRLSNLLEQMKKNKE